MEKNGKRTAQWRKKTKPEKEDDDDGLNEEEQSQQWSGTSSKNKIYIRISPAV